jgi:hypothetical protein
MSPLDVLSLVVSRLDKIGIEYMVGGSFASSAHGVPRSTQDADVVADLKQEQIGEFVELFRHDFYVDAGQVKEAVWRKRSFNIIHLQAYFKIDIFVLGNRGFDREQFSRRELQPVSSGTEGHVYIASAEDCVLSKLDWYRMGGGVSDTQWRDVIGVLKSQVGELDFGYLSKWASELGVAHLLKRACREAGVEGA